MVKQKNGAKLCFGSDEKQQALGERRNAGYAFDATLNYAMATDGAAALELSSF